jgi:tagatose 6-phosphate kinase
VATDAPRSGGTPDQPRASLTVPVLAVSVNPAVDVTYAVAAVRRGTETRVRAVRTSAGGKAVNVARILARRGTPVTVTGFAGGHDGATLRAGVVAAGAADRLVTIGGATRRTTTVVEDDGTATGLLEPGPVVTATEWRELCRLVGDLALRTEVVVLSGSLPGGLPDDAYAVLTDIAHGGGAAVILDAAGPALRAGVGAGPEIVKPNRAELRALNDAGPANGDGSDDAGGDGGDGGGWDADVEGARRLLSAGARAVVVSAGAEGMVAVTAEGGWRARPPEVVVGNPTGAGDAAVAALARGLLTAASWPVVLADAVALSAAAVAAPTAGAFSGPDYLRWRRAVAVCEIGGSPCRS